MEKCEERMNFLVGLSFCNSPPAIWASSFFIFLLLLKESNEEIKRNINLQANWWICIVFVFDVYKWFIYRFVYYLKLHPGTSKELEAHKTTRWHGGNSGSDRRSNEMPSNQNKFYEIDEFQVELHANTTKKKMWAQFRDILGGFYLYFFSSFHHTQSTVVLFFYILFFYFNWA